MKRGVNLNRILKNNRALFLAYDQGLEHGSKDFNDKNYNPEYIIDIANRGRYNAIILQKGVAEKYREKIKIPLILKLNGKTNLYKGEPISTSICSVEEAVRLRAAAIGYTVYIGSQYENIMLSEFGKIQEEAHKKKLAVIAWIYPRGKSVRRKSKRELMVYAARVGLEIGADIVKINYNDKIRDLEYAVKCAGRTKIVIAGGVKEREKVFFKQAKEIMKAGASGLAIGRNVWQSKEPFKVTKELKRIIFGNETV